MAIIYYRFKSQRPDKLSTINFDGTGLTVFELKKEIITTTRLFTASDTDILLYHSEDQDIEYQDDNEVIPRALTVLVRRTSAGKKGKGNIARYIAGKPRLMRGNILSTTTNSTNIAPSVGPITSASVGQNEEDMISQMFNQQEDQWVQQQAVMATAHRVDNGRSNRSDEKVPEYYICYKCGEKGQHQIRNCPKNNDPNWDGIRVKKTTGIPKSQLKTVENPGEMGDDPNNMNYMVTEEGKFVVAVADKKAWQNYQDIQQSKQEKNDDIDVDDPELKDPHTGKLLKTPVKTRCCNKTYSRHIIEQLLIDEDFKCPNCGEEDIYLDSLENDTEMQEKVTKYLQDKKRKSEDSNDAGNVKRQKLTSPAPGQASLPQIPQHNPNSMAGATNTAPMPIPMMPFMPFPAPMSMPMGMPLNMQNMNSNNNGQSNNQK